MIPSGAGYLAFSLFDNVYSICHYLFSLHLDAIERLIFMLVALPTHLLYIYCSDSDLLSHNVTEFIGDRIWAAA